MTDAATAPAPTNGAEAPAKQEPVRPTKPVQPTPPAKTAEAPEWTYEDELEVKGRKERVKLSKEEVRKRLQIGKHFEQKAGAIAEAEKQWKRREAIAKEDPFAALAELGVPEDVLVERATKALLERAKLETMSEEQRHSHELEAENARLKQEKEEFQKAQQERATQEKRKALVQRNTAEFTEAMESGGLPKTATTLYFMADTQELRLRAGLPPYQPKELAAATRKRLAQNSNEVFAGLEGAPLVEMVGRDLALRITRALAAEHEAKRASTQLGSPSETTRRPPSPVEKTYTESDAEERFRQLKKSFR